MIYDSHGRLVNYLRIAVTDRCNLRCSYCMPHDGLDWLPQQQMLSYEEMLRICSLLAQNGIQKIRITGGEPFIRKDLIYFLADLIKIKGIQKISVTTNGVLTAPFIPQLYDLGIRSINLSLDTLDKYRFLMISRRDELDKVLSTLELLLDYKMQVKLNTVVMDNLNTQDIIPIVALTKQWPLAVRFIEEMPFNGEGKVYSGISWDHVRILNHIQEFYPQLCKLDDPPYSTSYNYSIPGHKGSFGIIAAYTRSFCGSCNRLRITPQGEVKTCLYGKGQLNIRDLIRSGMKDEAIAGEIINAIQNRAANGWQAEAATLGNLHPSMAEIGG